FPNLRIKQSVPDSLYIKTYPNYLSVGAHVLSPSIRTDINSRKSLVNGFDPAMKLRTNIADIAGLSVSYRFISAGFAFLLKSGMNMHDDYAKSKYRTATIKYSSEALMLQFKYIRIKGFTDINTNNHPEGNPPYTLRDDLTSKEFQFEALYNFDWKRYSYIAPLTFSQRQVKSRAGFLLKTGIYYHQLYSDSSLMNAWQRPYYPDLAKAKVLRSLTLRIAPGAGGNLVFNRCLYFSFATFVSYDLYLYKYLDHPDDKVSGRQAFVFTVDGKFGFGYQSRRLYAGIRYEVENRIAALHDDVSLNAFYGYTGIEIGYRFDAPGVLRKVYRKTMPPGM
uniref:DUF4421 domain-containing protein n=1 Tax=Ohtaekwangia sp. TaxID=2066019 RepID=UPI002FDCF15A